MSSAAQYEQASEGPRAPKHELVDRLLLMITVPAGHVSRRTERRVLRDTQTVIDRHNYQSDSTLVI